MKSLLASVAGVVVATLALTGCAHSAERTMTLSQTTSVGEVRGRPSFAMPFSLPGSKTLLIPFALEHHPGLFEDWDKYAESGFSGTLARSASGRAQPVRWHNAVFKDMDTGDEWTVLDCRGVISWWTAFVRGQPEVCRMAAFVATLKDTNRDGVLDDRDGNVVILAGPDGRGPRVVSPPDSQVWRIAADPNRDQLYMLVVTDTDHDGRFTSEDVAMPYVARLAPAEPARPLVEAATRAKVEELLK